MSTVALCAALPLFGACLVGLTGRWRNVRDGITLFCSCATAALVWSLVPRVVAGQQPEWVLGEAFAGIELAFKLEPLGMLYACVASSLWIVTSLYAIGYMRGHHEQHQTRFFACFALAISCSIGIAFARNLLTLFLFYELLTFSTYPLVTHHQSHAARHAGRTYLGILVFTSVGMLLWAIAWTWHLTGTLEFTPGGLLRQKVDGWVIPLLLGLFAFGTGKAALMPFHRWLPAAMVAPTPVSALLHAVAVVKAGVFTILKVVIYVFGLDVLRASAPSQWLMVVASFTLLMASGIAIAQDNLKRRLAYSTISHLSYIVLGAALATPNSAMGGGLHIVMHAVAKITLFFCAGAIYVAAHKTKVSELNGLGRRMPFTMAAFALASFSLIGLPPFGGSWSKWFLIVGAFDSERGVYAAVLILSSLLSIAYLMPVVARAFFFPHAEDTRPEGNSYLAARSPLALHEAPLLCVIPLCITAVGSSALFFLAEPMYRLLEPVMFWGHS